MKAKGYTPKRRKGISFISRNGKKSETSWIMIYICGFCEQQVWKFNKYCSDCGRKIRWLIKKLKQQV